MKFVSFVMYVVAVTALLGAVSSAVRREPASVVTSKSTTTAAKTSAKVITTSVKTSAKTPKVSTKTTSHITRTTSLITSLMEGTVSLSASSKSTAASTKPVTTTIKSISSTTTSASATAKSSTPFQSSSTVPTTKIISQSSSAVPSTKASSTSTTISTKATATITTIIPTTVSSTSIATTAISAVATSKTTATTETTPAISQTLSTAISTQITDTTASTAITVAKTVVSAKTTTASSTKTLLKTAATTAATATTTTTVVSTKTGTPKVLIGYWGQDTVYYDSGSLQGSLLSYCQSKNWDYINLAFMNIFTGGSNNYLLNFANFGTYDTASVTSAATTAMTSIRNDVTACQKLGVKILLSIGGASGDYSLSSGTGVSFATLLYESFFLGANASIPRPFGTAVLDGIDWDIEATIGSQADIVVTNQKLKLLDSNILISAAPQCPFPDAYIGIKFPIAIALPGSPNSASNGFATISQLTASVNIILQGVYSNSLLGLAFWDVSSTNAYEDSGTNNTLAVAARLLVDGL
ncbi:hypothetical protein HK100_010986 [Physocladia obscura]|uniref:GH18 domain-containing protein n=1 Tax=Physocladia obscura TaxID=109957 RepID=A0AAD5T385_9FUNG|nr:hypothetical protein HK100_010986 [Physocladia obscura]